MRKLRKRRHGFSLLEMIIVVAISALILGMAYRMIISSNRIWAEEEARNAANRAGWQWAIKASGQLRMAIPPAELGEGAQFAGRHKSSTLYEALRGRPGIEEFADEMRQVQVSEDIMRFPAVRVPGKGGKLVPGMCEYSLKRREDGLLVGAGHRSAPLGESLDDQGLTLDGKDVVSLGFQYLTSEDNWVQEWSDAAALPRAVRISAATLVSPAGAKPQVSTFSTVVYLPGGRRISP